MVPDIRLADSEKVEASLCLENLHKLRPQDFGLPAFNYSPVGIPFKSLKSIKKSSKATHVIFDMDGLLLDTQAMYSAVSQQLLAENGRKPDFDFKMKVSCDL